MSFYTTIASRPEYRIMFASDQTQGQLVEARNVLSCLTHKALHEPAGGFEITLDCSQPMDTTVRPPVPLPFPTWEEGMHPMAYVEIALRRDGEAGANGQFKTVMRGFVDFVRRTETIERNIPQRRIVIGGRDWLGKAWSVVRFLAIAPPETDQIQQVLLDYGISIANQTYHGLFVDLLQKTVGVWLDQVRRRIPVVPVPVYDADDITPDNLVINQWSPTAIGDAMYNQVASLFDAPWMELFTADYDDRSAFVMRYARYRQWNNLLTTPFGMPRSLPQHTISKAIVPAKNTVRIDNEVLNYFFVVSKFGMQTNDPIPYIYTPQINPFVVGDSIDKEGLQPMHNLVVNFTTNQGQLFDALQAAADVTSGILDKLAPWLAYVYGANQYLHSGVFKVKGETEYAMGEEVTDTSTGLRYYITGVDHEFVYPYQNNPGSYLTTLSCIRGVPPEGVPEVKWSVPKTAYTQAALLPNIAADLQKEFVGSDPRPGGRK